MSAEAIEETISKNAIASGGEQNAIAEWEPPMPPTDLIFDNSEAVVSQRASGEPLETNRCQPIVLRRSSR